MANSQTIALVAVGISMVSIGLLVGVQLSLQSDLRTLNNNLIEQSQQINFLSKELKENQQSIEDQQRIINAIQSELNMTSAQLLEHNDKMKSLSQRIDNMQSNITLMQDKIKSLEARVTLLEPRFQSTMFEPASLTDGSGNKWTSHYIKGSNPDCESVAPNCFVHIAQVNTPYDGGVAVDSIGSSDYDYYFLAYSEEYVAPADGIVNISGKFLKKDQFYSSGLEKLRSRSIVFILSQDPDIGIHQQFVLTEEEDNGVWYDKKVSFKLEPKQVFRVGIGRTDSWVTDWGLYVAWSDIKVNAELK